MFGLNNNSDYKQYLEHYHELLKLAEQERLAHQAKGANPSKPVALHTWHWLEHLLPAHHQHNRVAHPMDAAHGRS